MPLRSLEFQGLEELFLGNHVMQKQDLAQAHRVLPLGENGLENGHRQVAELDHDLADTQARVLGLHFKGMLQLHGCDMATRHEEFAEACLGSG